MTLQLAILGTVSDTKHQENLVKHLASLRRSGKLTTWSSDNLLIGASLRTDTRDALVAADLIAFLVSSDFMAADNLWENELNLSLERRKQGEAVWLLPIMVEPCMTEGTFLAELQALPRYGKAVSQHANADEVWASIAKEIGVLVDQFHAKVQQVKSHAAATTTLSPALQSIVNSKNVISGSVIIVGGNLTIGD
jgi:hypothetical protein